MQGKKLLVLGIVEIIIGLVLLVLSINGIFGFGSYTTPGLYVMFLALGVLQIVRYKKYRDDPEYKAKTDIEKKDERNSFIQMKSWAFVSYVICAADVIGWIVAMILKQKIIMQVLGYSILLILVTYFVAYLVFSRKY